MKMTTVSLSLSPASPWWLLSMLLMGTSIIMIHGEQQPQPHEFTTAFVYARSTTRRIRENTKHSSNLQQQDPHFHPSLQQQAQEGDAQQVQYHHNQRMMMKLTAPNRRQETPVDDVNIRLLSDRRNVLAKLGVVTFASLLLFGGGGSFMMPSFLRANAVVMDTSSSSSSASGMTYTNAPLGLEACKDRFVKAQADLDYVLQNYDSVVANGGGDNVRRYLGTVGVTSNLNGINKILKELQEEANDIVEYTEAMQDFDAALRGADTACYSANFVDYSAAKTKPEEFFATAKTDIQTMAQAMKRMRQELP